MSARLKRRSLLAAGAALSVGFLAGCSLPVMPRRPVPERGAASGWVQHDGQGFLLWLPRAEMGQGVDAGLQQLAAEALGIARAELRVRGMDSARMQPVRATVGSDSIKDFALPLVQACVLLREGLRRGLTQQQLAQLPLPAVDLRGAGREVGQPRPSPDAEALLRGAPLFAADLRLPGMLYGTVLRAPGSPLRPSQLLAADEAAARGLPGFVALVRDARWQLAQAQGLGLLARTPGALQRCAAALQPRWREQAAKPPGRTDLDAAAQHRVLQQGQLDPAGPWDVDMRLEIPHAAHAGIEPRAAVARPDGRGGVEVWVGSQDPFYVRDVLAKTLGLDARQVRVHAMRIGGAFGGRTLVTVELEAALLALAAKAPVKVQWSRAQEFQLGFHRPASTHRIRARLQEGRLLAWQHRFASGPILFTPAGFPPWLQGLVSGVAADAGVARGALPPYRVANCEVGFDSLWPPVPTGPWRGLGAGPNGLALESAIDDCARQAGADPLQFRLAHLDPSAQPRLHRALLALQPAWKAGPIEQPPAGWRLGRGLACGIYKNSSYGAVIAELWLQRETGELRLRRLQALHDCGLVVNPDRVRAQCEGNLIWGLGMVLVEELPLRDDGSIAATQFAESPIPRLPQLPDMQIDLLDEGEAPGGAGETLMVAAGAAVLNAVRDAAGWRPTRLPLRAEALRAGPPRA